MDKCLKGWTTLACHMYDNKYSKVLTIVCCNMQSKDGAIRPYSWKNLNSVMAKNGVSDANFKGFMADSAHANWNAVMKIYGEGGPKSANGGA